MLKKFLSFIVEFIWSLADGQQPYIKNTRNHKLIDYWWSKIFCDEKRLRYLTRQCATRPRKGYGLIYYYFVGKRLRYIGQTKERSLKWRMIRRQPGGSIGYSYTIKRQMLNAYISDRLIIKTKQVRLKDLDSVEQTEIKTYGKYGKLWNIEHNRHYKDTNRWA